MHSQSPWQSWTRGAHGTSLLPAISTSTFFSVQEQWQNRTSMCNLSSKSSTIVVSADLPCLHTATAYCILQTYSINLWGRHSDARTQEAAIMHMKTCSSVKKLQYSNLNINLRALSLLVLCYCSVSFQLSAWFSMSCRDAGTSVNPQSCSIMFSFMFKAHGKRLTADTNPGGIFFIKFCRGCQPLLLLSLCSPPNPWRICLRTVIKGCFFFRNLLICIWIFYRVSFNDSVLSEQNQNSKSEGEENLLGMIV